MDTPKSRKLASVSPPDPGYTTGYETDNVTPSLSKRSKTKLKKKRSKTSLPNDPGYETDDGYTSTSSKPRSKSRIFRLGNRSKSNIQIEEPVPPPPPLPEPVPVFRLPIAAKFATTLGDINPGATLDPQVSNNVELPPAPSPLPQLESLFKPLDDSFTRDVIQRSSTDELEPTPTNNSLSQVNPVPSPAPVGRRRGSSNITSVTSSDSSDAHGSSSTGHSFFSKWTTSSSASSSSPHPKYPPISYPLTRSPSPPSPTLAQKTSIPNLRKVPEPLNIDISLSIPESRSRNPSPGGWSPFIVVTPNPSSTPEPDRSASPATRRPLFLARNVNPPSPKTTVPRPYLTPADDVPSSTDFVVPSPRSRSPMPVRSYSPALQPPPPNLLAQRDLPPPSPPPTIALPKAPTQTSYFATEQQNSRQRRQFVINSPRPSVEQLESMSAAPPPRRGKEAPFPSRPVLPTATVTQPGLEARVRVRRYRDLYTLPQAWDEPETAEDPIYDVVSRFKPPSEDGSMESSELVRPALGRKQSAEALLAYDSDDRSHYPESEGEGRSTMYRNDTAANSTSHLSTWSGEEALRLSIMDIEKSETARVRFVERVEQLFDQNGREIPPVPKLPEAYTRSPAKQPRPF